MKESKRGKVLAVNTSEEKGMKKTNIQSCALLKDFGLKGDAHGGPWHRQVSLLATESIAIHLPVPAESALKDTTPRTNHSGKRKS